MLQWKWVIEAKSWRRLNSREAKMLEGFFIVDIEVTKNDGSRAWNEEEGCEPKSAMHGEEWLIAAERIEYFIY